MAYDKRIGEKPLTTDVRESRSAKPFAAVCEPQMIVIHADTLRGLRQDMAEVAEIVTNERAVEDDAAVEDKPSAPQSKSRSQLVSVSNDMRVNKHRGGLRIALYATRMPKDESLGMKGYLALSEHGTPDNTPPMFAKANIGNFDYLALVNDGKNPVTDARHDQPVRFGLSVGYDISRRWGVSVGATYTKLRSTLTADIGGGAELRVYRSLGIFAEVGAAYYFDNNGKYTTIYSAHPLNLDLQFCVRWTLNSKE